MMQALGAALAQVRWADLPPQTQRKLQLCVLANLSVAVAGAPGVRLPRPELADVGYLLIDGGQTAQARAAAFYNAALMHARTQDDFHPVGNLHIATVVIPAALAAAQQAGVTGQALLDAIATGYTAAIGMSRRFSALTTPRGLRSTSLYTPFGATAAVARIWQFDGPTLANALALSATLNVGTTQCWLDGSDEWQLHVASAAANALLACELTRGGVRGGAQALDGAAGFYRALVGTPVSFADLAEELDAVRAIDETVLKRYPVSGICQPVVRLAERLAASAPPAGIRRVTIQMHAFDMNYPGTLNRGPFRSFSDRLMSAAFCCASVLAAGSLRFEDFFVQDNPLRERLLQAVVVEAGPDLGPLACRMLIESEEGPPVRGELLDTSRDLALDWSTIDEWAEPLWLQAGRTVQAYRQLRDAVLDLPNDDIVALCCALQKT